MRKTYKSSDHLLAEGVEPRILHSASPVDDLQRVTETQGDFDQGSVADSIAAPAAPTAPHQAITIAAGRFDSDPQGLTKKNENAGVNDAMVFIVDASNPNAVFDLEGVSREELSGEKPLGSLDILTNQSFVQPGDTFYLQSGDYTLNESVAIYKDGITIATYPDAERATIRHGSLTYYWALAVVGDDFTLSNIEFVGYKPTDQGKLYSSLGVAVLGGDNATIENSIFRHNASFLPSENGGDVGFGNRVDKHGNRLGNQRIGRLVQFSDSEGSVFRGNVVVPLEANTVEQWVDGSILTEGLLLQNSDVLVEENQFGPTGHHMLSIRESSPVVRGNTFGDVSDYEKTLGVELSEYVKVPSTLTSVAIYLSDNVEFSGNVVSYNHARAEDLGNGLQVQSSSNNEIFNNLFIDGRGVGYAISLGSSARVVDAKPTQNNRLYNNTFVNTTTPISIGYFAGSAPENARLVTGNEVFNNVVTIAEAGKQSPYRGENVPLVFDVWDVASLDGNRIYHNILFDYDGGAVFQAQVQGRITDGLDVATLNSQSFAYGNLNVEPVFANAKDGDFRLVVPAGQEALYSGVSVPETDLLGNKRAFTSIGAFDYLR